MREKGQQRSGTNGIFKLVHISVYVKCKLNDSPIKRWKLSECTKSKIQWYIVYNRKTFNIKTHKNRRMEICGWLSVKCHQEQIYDQIQLVLLTYWNKWSNTPWGILENFTKTVLEMIDYRIWTCVGWIWSSSKEVNFDLDSMILANWSNFITEYLMNII